MPVLLLILLLPLTEIALFILVGNRIGVAPVLVLTILSLIVGVVVLRANNARAAAMMRDGLRNVSPGTMLAQGAFATLAGLLLLLPGFLTDALGLLLLLPPLQRLIMRALAGRVQVHSMHMTRAGTTIEGDYQVHPGQDDPQYPAGYTGDRLLPPRNANGHGATPRNDSRH
ncbi:MAG: FxsA family protein [Pararhodobacter sp.]|nr:FxsA family protein [Pararhodobacter sp.]